MTQFAEKLRMAREAMGLSQAKLAEILDVKPSAVSRWEKGGGIEAFRLPVIAEKLGRPVEWFQGQSVPEVVDDIAELKERLARIEAAQFQSENLSAEELDLLRDFRGATLDGRQAILISARTAPKKVVVSNQAKNNGRLGRS